MDTILCFLYCLLSFTRRKKSSNSNNTTLGTSTTWWINIRDETDASKKTTAKMAFPWTNGDQENFKQALDPNTKPSRLRAHKMHTSEIKFMLEK